MSPLRNLSAVGFLAAAAWSMQPPVPTSGLCAGCGDGDPCTLDSCALNPLRCVHLQLQTAECSCAVEPGLCDDRDPCTQDACAGSAPPYGCVHTAVAGCH